MNKFGIVTKTEGCFASVKIRRDSMCGESCGECSLCGNKEIEIRAINSINAQKGDKVELKIPEKNGFAAAFLAYGAPIVILIFSIIIGTAAGFAEITVFAALALIAIWYVILMRLEKNKRYSEKLTPEIIKICK